MRKRVKQIFRGEISGTGQFLKTSSLRSQDSVTLEKGKTYSVVIKEVEMTEESPAEVSFGVFPWKHKQQYFHIHELVPNVLRIYHGPSKTRMYLSREEAAVLSEILDQVLTDDYRSQLIHHDVKHTDTGEKFYVSNSESFRQMYEEDEVKST